MFSFIKTQLSFKLCTTVLFFTLNSTIAATAQELAASEQTENTPTHESNKIVYKPEFFAQYHPVSATDILKQIPGIVIERGNRRGQGQRGFGSEGGNILINGKRISGKSNDSGNALERIQASQIESIEVIRGTSPDINAKNNDTIINIILKTSAQKTSVSWDLGFNQPEPNVRNPEAQLTVGGDYGQLNYLTTVQFKGHGGKHNTQRQSRNSSDVLFQTRDAEEIRSDDHGFISGNFIYTLNNEDEIRFNILLDQRDQEEKESRDQYTINSFGVSSFDERTEVIKIEDEKRIEIGGDYETHFDNGNSLKILALFNTLKETETDELNDLTTANPFTEDLEQTKAKEQEKIIRGSHQWLQLTDRQSLELGMEIAINSLDINVQLFEDNGNGTLIPVVLDLSDSLVEEVRFEFFSKHTWTITEKLFSELSLNYENSEITQTGSAITNSQNFSFIKPSIDIRYDVNSNEQIKLSINRSIGQLDFEDFVDSISQEDRNINAGNPNLKPDSTTEYAVNYENRPTDHSGVYSARIFYKDISDHIDRIISANGTDSATGNAGDALIYGIELESSTKLAIINLPHAVLTLKAIFQNSETVDFFRGTKRDVRFTPDQEFSLKFHHDITTHRLSYGMNLNWQSTRYYGDIEEDRFMTQDTSVYAYLEKHLIGNMKIRFTARNIADYQRSRFRRLYNTNKVNNLIEENESQKTAFTEEYHLILSGAF